MKIIDPYYEILTEFDGHELQRLELIARTCYKSGDGLSTKESAEKFVKGLINRHHEAMLEHGGLTVKFVVDRGVSHELVRHRMASFAQESTRYCNYSKDKFENEITFINPFFFAEGEKKFENPKWLTWRAAMEEAEEDYMALIGLGATPQEARSVLPSSTKTEVVMTANYREWRHFFKLRAARETGPAHPQMEQVTWPLLFELNEKLPIIFEDIVESMLPFR